MNPRLDGSVVLVTGASSGIGMALARELAPRAKSLVLVARRLDRLQSLEKDLRARHPRLQTLVVSCDVTDQNEVDKLLARVHAEIGEIDILVNNAGMGDISFFEDSDWAKLRQMIELNVVSLVYLTRKLIGSMIRKKRGGVLMVSSTAGFESLPGFGTYSATKFFVRGFSEALRAEVHEAGVAVTQLCPGPVATEFAAVALPGTDLQPPGFIEISADHCARAAVQGFERGRAVVIPGLFMKAAMFGHRFMPQAVLRLAFIVMTSQIRKSVTRKQSRLGA